MENIIILGEENCNNLRKPPVEQSVPHTTLREQNSGNTMSTTPNTKIDHQNLSEVPTNEKYNFMQAPTKKKRKQAGILGTGKTEEIK
ncbi:hypothetical protein HHI36_023253, partial [Cryptolaemus montrouzieri]